MKAEMECDLWKKDLRACRERFIFFSLFKIARAPGFEFVKTWLNAPGWPPYSPDLSAHEVLTVPARDAADLFSTTRALEHVPDIERWSTYKIIHVLDLLAERSPLPADGLQKLMAHCPFLSHTHNSEVRLRWCEIIIKNDIQEKCEDIKQFLRSQGKQKYTKPLYQQMAKGSQHFRKLATEIFRETKASLHTNVRDYVKDILEKGGCLE